MDMKTLFPRQQIKKNRLNSLNFYLFKNVVRNESRTNKFLRTHQQNFTKQQESEAVAWRMNLRERLRTFFASK